MTKETVEKYVQAIDGKSLATVRGGKKDKNGAIIMPWVDYDDVIIDTKPSSILINRAIAVSFSFN
jgi:hypothetical protein